MLRVCRFLIVSLLLLPLLGYASELDAPLRAFIAEKDLQQPFQADLEITNSNRQLVDLGGDIFFSPDLSIDGSVSCASCHHPEKAGADGIPLPIGIGGGHSENVGQARIDAAEKIYTKFTLNGLIPRNSPTVFNSSLYTKALFWDGRAQYITSAEGKKMIKAGFGVSPYTPNAYQQDSLLQTQARMPITSPFEMKGGLLSNRNDHEIEQSVVALLRSNEQWCQQFNRMFKMKSCSKSLTLDNITLALASYQASLVFVDSPFQNYIDGDSNALTTAQKRGALLFFSNKEQGGFGCTNCHTGKIFSSQEFFNLGLPASGLGANEKGWDFGRHNVDKEYDRSTFRVPSLLNIEKTAPYFHNGIAHTLEEAVMFHTSSSGVDKAIHRIKLPGIDYVAIDKLTTDEYRANAMAERLPLVISENQLKDVVAFLRSLTDKCVNDIECLKKYNRPIIETARPDSVVDEKKYLSKKRALPANDLKSSPITCIQPKKVAKGKLMFSMHSVDIGLNHKRTIGKVKEGWFMDLLNLGGLSVTDVNNDCLDDVIFDAGAAGLVFYLQQADGQFVKKELSFPVLEDSISPLLLDFDGDYKTDLFVGTMGQHPPYIVYDFLGEQEVVYLPGLTGPVINASFGDIDLDGDLDAVFAFWRSFKSMQQSHIWVNNHGTLLPHNTNINLIDIEKTDTLDHVEKLQYSPGVSDGGLDLSFTPNFVDIDGDGDADLLLTTDFGRSQIWRNENGMFIDITNKKVIDDDNGMGVAIGDFENNGLLDWYVTSIYTGSKGSQRGNKLYRNKGNLRFIQPVGFAPVPEVAWSWGACAKDFNNDGFEDIFYVSGWGEQVKTADYVTKNQQVVSERFLQSNVSYSNSYPRLLINDKKGGFIEMSKEFGLDKPFDGRGISCFDYEQDGDIDIMVNPVEGSPVLYRNHLDGLKNWVAFKIVGLPKNTESFATKIILYTAKGKQYREVRFENNYLSRNSAQVHFGLDDLHEVDKVEIRFARPDGRIVIITKPEINRLHIINQASQ